VVWASLFLDLPDRPYAIFDMKFENDDEITVLTIIESVKRNFGRFLQNVSVSDLHVFSGHNPARFLNKEEVWKMESHGGGSEDDTLLVKVAMPFGMPNQGIGGGTCRFCRHNNVVATVVCVMCN
jgi:hypothetical protein